MCLSRSCQTFRAFVQCLWWSLHFLSLLWDLKVHWDRWWWFLQFFLVCWGLKVHRETGGDDPCSIYQYVEVWRFTKTQVVVNHMLFVIALRFEDSQRHSDDPCGFIIALGFEDSQKQPVMILRFFIIIVLRFQCCRDPDLAEGKKWRNNRRKSCTVSA